MVFIALVALFQLASLKKGWITIEKKVYYDRFLWGYAPVTLIIAILIAVIGSKGFEGVETALWLVIIWFAAIALEPAWASALNMADVYWPANWAYNVWFVSLCASCLWLEFIWFIWAKPGIEAGTIWFFNIIKLVLGW